ncbi:MAG TPA: zf-HC2 domain-containing protein [Gemmatimonadaceae bacterium]|nr:zf-HC2 domain-containing protein [Gemmatimonadaceae bacterium]
MRDLLPDLMHGRVPDGQRLALDAHLDGCAACRAELALLQRVREAARVPRVDTDRIVSALPPYRGRTFLASPMLRVAAAVVLVVGGSSLFLRAADREPKLLDTIAQASATAPVLLLGESFQDLSDTDLEALAEELGGLDGMLSEEPEEIMVPLEGSGS